LSSPVLDDGCRRRAVVEIEVGGEIEDRVAGDQVDSPLAESSCQFAATVCASLSEPSG